MKKFSKIAKVDSPKDEPVMVLTNEEKDLFNLRMMVEALVDQFLHLRIEGPIDPILQGTIFIEGKEEFSAALISSLALATDKKELSMLESARNRFIANDLQWIEEQIIDKSERINEYQSAGQLARHEEFVRDLMKSCHNDAAECTRIANLKVGKMKEGKKVFYRGMCAERLASKMVGDEKKAMLAIADVFMNKARELGYTANSHYIHKSTKKLN